MNIRTAIKTYEDKVAKSLAGELPFEFIHCKLECGCIIGIKWSDMKFENHYLITKNGFKYRLSMDLGNSLESKFYKLIRR